MTTPQGIRQNWHSISIRYRKDVMENQGYPYDAMLRIANTMLCHKDLCYLIDKNDTTDFGKFQKAYFTQKWNQLIKSYKK